MVAFQVTLPPEVDVRTPAQAQDPGLAAPGMVQTSRTSSVLTNNERDANDNVTMIGAAGHKNTRTKRNQQIKMKLNGG